MWGIANHIPPPHHLSIKPSLLPPIGGASVTIWKDKPTGQIYSGKSERISPHLWRSVGAALSCFSFPVDVCAHWKQRWTPQGPEYVTCHSAEDPRRDRDQGLDIQDHLCNMNASGACQSHQQTFWHPWIPLAYLVLTLCGQSSGPRNFVGHSPSA